MPIRPAFAAAVVALPRIAGDADDRGDRDDAAPALFHHRPQDGARQAECRGQVDAQHLVPFFVFHAHEQVVARDAGVARSRCRGRPSALRRSWAVRRLGRHRRDCRRRCARGRRVRLSSASSASRARARQRDGRALRVERAGDVAADAAAGARDQGGLAVEIEHAENAFRLERFQERFDVLRRFDREQRQFLVDAFGHRRQHFARADFDDGGDAVAAHAFDRFAPADAAGDLFDQQALDRRGIAFRLHADVRDHGHARRSDVRAAERVFHFARGLLHQRRMETAR